MGWVLGWQAPAHRSSGHTCMHGNERRRRRGEKTSIQLGQTLSCHFPLWELFSLRSPFLIDHYLDTGLRCEAISPTLMVEDGENASSRKLSAQTDVHRGRWPLLPAFSFLQFGQQSNSLNLISSLAFVSALHGGCNYYILFLLHTSLSILDGLSI